MFGIDAAAMTTLLAEVVMYWMTSRYAGKNRLVKHRGRLFMTAISLIECIIIYVQSQFIKQCSFHSVIRIMLLFIGSVISYFGCWLCHAQEPGVSMLWCLRMRL